MTIPKANIVSVGTFWGYECQQVAPAGCQSASWLVHGDDEVDLCRRGERRRFVIDWLQDGRFAVVTCQDLPATPEPLGSDRDLVDGARYARVRLPRRSLSYSSNFKVISLNQDETAYYHHYLNKNIQILVQSAELTGLLGTEICLVVSPEAIEPHAIPELNYVDGFKWTEFPW